MEGGERRAAGGGGGGRKAEGEFEGVNFIFD